MIRNIEELLTEEFNLRHFICHTATDSLNDPNATKKDFAESVCKGIEMWKMHMIELIIENSSPAQNADENKRKSIPRSKRKRSQKRFGGSGRENHNDR